MHRLHKIHDFEILENYEIRIVFEDKREQIINFEPVLYGEQWGPLRDLDIFRQVEICSITKNLVWPDDADFDPETLYNWSDYVEELSARAQSWEKIRV